MTNVEYLLVCLMEEAAEIAHVASKCLRFGLDEVWPGVGLRNVQRLADELCDLEGTIYELEDAGVLVRSLMRDGAVECKRKKIRDMMKYSRECGTLQDGPEIEVLRSKVRVLMEQRAHLMERKTKVDRENLSLMRRVRTLTADNGKGGEHEQG